MSSKEGVRHLFTSGNHSRPCMLGGENYKIIRSI
jgi:hypothetical protein